MSAESPKVLNSLLQPSLRTSPVAVGNFAEGVKEELCPVQRLEFQLFPVRISEPVGIGKRIIGRYVNSCSLGGVQQLNRQIEQRL